MNVYQIVTDRIIRQMEQGVIPWHKTWMSVQEGAFNRVSRHPYSLLNQMLLSRQGEYATYKQWHDLGGHVRKGAKSEMVVFWKLLEKKDPASEESEKKKKFPLLRYYNVFHISDVEGVDPLEPDPLHDTQPVEEAEKVFRGYVERENIKTEITLSNRAFYSPSNDVIHLPDIRQYENPSDFYSVAFHEATHSTGHKSRLCRFAPGEPIAPFGSEDYSKEELVAELGSAAILNTLGLETEDTFRDSASYIHGWLTVLKNDNHFIVSASAKADKAVDLIMGVAA